MALDFRRDYTSNNINIHYDWAISQKHSLNCWSRFMTDHLNRRELFSLFAKSSAFSLLAPALGLKADTLIQSQTKGPVKLGNNENPYGPSPKTRMAIIEAIDGANGYGFEDQREFPKILAEKVGVSVDNIVHGSGTAEIMRAVGSTFAGNNGEILSADLTFNLIPVYGMNIGANIKVVPLNDRYEHDLNAMASQTTNKTDVIYICNPNNPTGTTVNPDVLRDFCRSVSKKALIVVDEAYLDFTDNYKADSMVDLVHEDLNLIVMRTFSKIHGLAGLRIGFGVTRPQIAARLKSHKHVNFVNYLGIHAAKAALEDTEFHDFSRARIKKDRDILMEQLKSLGLEHTQARGNFVFFYPKMKHADFRARMAEKGVLTGRSFPPLDDWSRVAIGTSEDMQLLAKVLPEVIAGVR
jgi:histidinol-phosphate aminotransferase